MANITNIPAPRVNIIDSRTNLMSREWYLFFISLFNRTGEGTTDASLVDLQIMPSVQPPQNTTRERTNTVMIWLSTQ